MALAESLWNRGSRNLLETPAVQPVSERSAHEPMLPGSSRYHSSTSLREVGHTMLLHRRMMLSVVGGLLVACLLYCLIAPKQYEARARVALRIAPATALSLDGTDGTPSGSLAPGQTQLETLANVFRSDQLAWRVMLEKKLYQAPGFMGSFAQRFPNFNRPHRRPTLKHGCWSGSRIGCVCALCRGRWFSKSGFVHGMRRFPPTW